MTNNPKSISALKKDLDGIFSEFIRIRDADNAGTVTCFVSGARIFWKDADAAHWIVRDKMPTRYDERNVHACSRDSNRFDPDHTQTYTVRLMDRYGKGIANELLSKSIGLQKFTRPELELMIMDYKRKVKALKKQKGL